LIYYAQSPGYDASAVQTWYLAAVGVAFADTVFNTLSLYLFGLLSKSTVDRLRREAFSRVIRMPIGWF
jgi:hypothetical protein